MTPSRRLRQNTDITPRRNCIGTVNNEIVFQSKADHPQTGYRDTFFASVTLTVDPMTLMYQLDLAVLKGAIRFVL